MSIRNTNLIWTGKIIKKNVKMENWIVGLYRFQNKSQWKLNLNLNCLEICVKRIFFFCFVFRVDFKANFWIMYLFFAWYINSTQNNLRAFFFYTNSSPSLLMLYIFFCIFGHLQYLCFWQTERGEMHILKF